MTTTTDRTTDSQRQDPARPYLVVSCDSHAGPSLEDQLRQYCPKQYLEEFDDFVRGMRAAGTDWFDGPTGKGDGEDLPADAREEGLATLARIRENPGSMEAGARLADMDEQGIASELIFAGAQNPQALPWQGRYEPTSAGGLTELHAVGGHMWNEWLADFCSAAPERLLGVAQIPIWDIDAAVNEVHWAKEHGLRAINFPAPRPDYAPYNRRGHYEPFWSAVTEVGLPLVTHSNSGERSLGLNDQGGMMVILSELLWMSRRGLGQLIFGGVFDRHPTLTVAFVEQRGNWVVQALHELDSAYWGARKNAPRTLLGAFVEAPQRLPSEYWQTNCVVGASFMAPYEAEMRHEIGIDTLMWGSDYPHLEGTWPRTKLAMRNTFAGIPEDEVRRILGANGARVFDLDLDVLEPIAAKIGPTPDELATPLREDEFPKYRGLAFREGGSYY